MDLNYGGQSALKRGPMAKCSGCGRVYEQEEDNQHHCNDCKRLVRLGLKPIKSKVFH